MAKNRRVKRKWRNSYSPKRSSNNSRLIFGIVIGGAIVAFLFLFGSAFIHPMETKISLPVKTPVTSQVSYSKDRPVTSQPTQKIIPTPSKPTMNIQELEQHIHALINDNRQKNGIVALTYDSQLATIARTHSQDMAKNNFFAHENLKGNGPTDRANNAGYITKKSIGNNRFQIGIGENIYQMTLYSRINYNNGVSSYDWYTQETIAELIVDGWMNSPGHRLNILTSTYDREGIGVAISDTNKVYATEDFF